MDHSRADIEALAAKIDGLRLTKGERAALNAVLEAAIGDTDVSGYAATNPTSADRYANQEVGYLLFQVLGTSYIGETEKNLRRRGLPG